MAASKSDLNKVAGPDAMAAPQRPAVARQNTEASSSNVDRNATITSMPSLEGGSQKKKRHRGGRKRRNRRQSFIAPSEGTQDGPDADERPSLLDVPRTSAQQASFYRLQGGKGSNTSLESEALLDHREHGPLRSRRRSLSQSFARPSIPFARTGHRPSHTSLNHPEPKQRYPRAQGPAIDEDDEAEEDGATDRTPLLSSSANKRPNTSRQNSTGQHGSYGTRRRASAASSVRHRHATVDEEDYDVNNPPSVPGSPKLGSLDDVMIAEEFSHGQPDRGRDAIINIDPDEGNDRFSSSSPEASRRRPTMANLAENDVCYPGDGDITEIGEGDEEDHGSQRNKPRRRRAKQWPDLDVLDEWSNQEKEEKEEEQIRAKKIAEPVMVGGRLRPGKTVWHREEDDAPFRYTYFNETIKETIHGRTISDLIQDGGSFRDLFIPEPVELSDASEDDDDDEDGDDGFNMERRPMGHNLNGHPLGGNSKHGVPGASASSDVGKERSPSTSKAGTGSNTPSGPQSTSVTPTSRPLEKRSSKRFGPRPTFWLDVLKPTEMEMKVLAKTFGIHQLTTEDVLMEEPREKVELFQSYYFVNYRSFEQDKDNEDYMEPVNMYVVVFRDGVISFHHSMTPHPANVRRRIRQLNDYMSPTADWISYAIIDDVTDVYAPLVQQIEAEVDEIDDDILYLHSHRDDPNMENKKNDKKTSAANDYEKMAKNANGSERGTNNIQNQGDMGKEKAEGDNTAGESGGDMLRRVGECRKKVMGLYRLLGNKADVIKGFAKRCNEHWEVAPRSEIGLYLGDIQDHIVTMTGNLSHYENLLSRAHSNYLAQINIRMNERAEQTADVLGKLTVLGTIVLPMNIITGMWGMNVWVPGQEYEGSLTWFWCITAGLLAFGLTCYFVAKRVYGIV